jgi:MerR family transcriptional regulator, light-induced transcriptional regulator
MTRRTERAGAGSGEQAGALHPIGVVAERTGLSLHVLRAWEKRYGVVEPRRTSGGQRLYTERDIVRLRLLRRVTDAGRQIGQVAGLPQETLEELVRGDAAAAEEARRAADASRAGSPVRASPASPPGSGRDGADAGVGSAETERVLSEALEAGRALDANRLNSILTRAVVSLRPLEFVHGVAVPLLESVGRAWESARLSPAEEHLVSAVLRRVLGWLLDTFQPEVGSPLLVATTFSGERHEFGALLAAVVAAEQGWRVVYLGADLPAHEVAGAARRLGAAAVALSAVYPPAALELEEELTELRHWLDADVRIFVGGRAAGAHRERLVASGVAVIASLSEWRWRLEAPTHGGGQPGGGQPGGGQRGGSGDGGAQRGVMRKGSST